MRRRLRGRRRARRDRSTAAARCSMAHLDNLRTRGPRWPRDEHRRQPSARRVTPCSPAEVSIACERLRTLRAHPAQSRAITLRPSIEFNESEVFSGLVLRVTERFLLMASSTSRPLPTTTARRIQPIKPPSEGRWHQKSPNQPGPRPGIERGSYPKICRCCPFRLSSVQEHVDVHPGD